MSIFSIFGVQNNKELLIISNQTNKTLFLYTKFRFCFGNQQTYMGNNVKPYTRLMIILENILYSITFWKHTILRFQTSQCPQFCQSEILNI
jgi:hypothetical protein